MIRPRLSASARISHCVQGAFRIALLVIAGILLAGCARTQLRQPAPLEPIVIPAAGLDPAPFEAVLARRLNTLEAFRGRGVMELALRGQSPRRFDFLVVADDAGRVRLRGERALGPPLFELVADTEKFVLLIPAQLRAYEGRRNDPNPEAGLPVPASVVDPVWITLAPDSLRFLERRPGSATLVELTQAGPGAWRPLRRIVFAQDTGLVRQLTAFDGNAELTQVVHLDDYRALRGDDAESAFPFHMHVSRPQGDLDLTLEFRSVEPNVAVPESAYAVAPPPGYTVLPARDFHLGETLPTGQSSSPN